MTDTFPHSASDEEIVRDLQSASAELNYPSESDYPFEAFVWKATEPDALKQIRSGAHADSNVVETSVDDFFADLVVGDDAPQFAELRRVVESRLAEPRVLRIGHLEVNVYLVGRTPNGSWAGLRTVSVET
ncbi:MAG TPA: nuclease A inhibitor family protein [Tepidisphaeraceae bacterium]|nr:nuclease A inhibitor family protein [Tepidisphaeraceae bacterium]